MNIKKTFFYVIFLIWAGFWFSVSAQEEGSIEISDPTKVSNTNASLSVSSAAANPNIMLARSSVDYMVTPGDVYTLAYSAGATSVSYTITVDTSYRIRISNMGIVNGAGKTFPQLRREIENIVTNNYPLSGVQLVLTQPSVFMVSVKGEVNTTTERSAWALNRLSWLVDGSLTKYASIRDISVKSSNGQTKVYDLFRAQRLGDMSQDPYLRPGDIVTFNRIKRIVNINGEIERPDRYQLMDGENLHELIGSYANGFTPIADKTRVRLTRYVGSAEISGDITYLSKEDLAGNYVLQDMDVIFVPAISNLRPAVYVNRIERTITITGEVRRPGTYELMPDENLRDMIEVYADGFMATADPSRMEMVRLVNGEYIAGDKLFLTEKDVNNNFSLEHYDMIYVPSITQLKPVMFVEGAVKEIIDETKRDRDVETSNTLVSSNRIVIQFSMGDTYASIVRSNSKWFTAISDTLNAYIIRKDQRIPINLNPMLYDATYRDEVLINENDVLVIPFRQYFVTVSGAVTNPGRYPYIPDRDWEYYIALAGGFLPGRNSFDSVIITDLTGKRLQKTSAITPETIISARTNHALYFFNQYAPVVTTALSVITTFISIILLTR